MTQYFLGSSALIKRYVAEPGTPWVRSIQVVRRVEDLLAVHPLRAYDSVQLASAIESNTRLVAAGSGVQWQKMGLQCLSAGHCREVNF